MDLHSKDTFAGGPLVESARPSRPWLYGWERRRCIDSPERDPLAWFFGLLLVASMCLYLPITVACAHQDSVPWTPLPTKGKCWSSDGSSSSGNNDYADIGTDAGVLAGVAVVGLVVTSVRRNLSDRLCGGGLDSIATEDDDDGLHDGGDLEGVGPMSTADYKLRRDRE